VFIQYRLYNLSPFLFTQAAEMEADADSAAAAKAAAEAVRLAAAAATAAPYDALDMLPLSKPPHAAVTAARAAAAAVARAPPGFEGDPEGAPAVAFLPEKEYRERARALMEVCTICI